MTQSEHSWPTIDASVTEDTETGTAHSRDWQRWAAAVGDLNPLYFDPEFARAHGFDGVIMPPMYLGQVVSGITFQGSLREDGTCGVAGVEVPGLERRVHGGEETEFFLPVYAGDTLTARRRLVNVEEKHGRSGRFVRMTWHITYENQRDELVAETYDSTIAR